MTYSFQLVKVLRIARMFLPVTLPRLCLAAGLSRGNDLSSVICRLSALFIRVSYLIANSPKLSTVSMTRGRMGRKRLVSNIMNPIFHLFCCTIILAQFHIFVNYKFLQLFYIKVLLCEGQKYFKEVQCTLDIQVQQIVIIQLY